MDNVVAARRLRKSMLKNIENIDLDPFVSYSKRDIYTDEVINEEKSKDKKSICLKSRVLIKIFLSVTIIFISLVIKLSFYNEL